ncbi:MAG: hypothetical protein HYS05_21720 [Acidobacteria bacterium]|nr:hypothetical protein [Acidobacteriota bacterium]
MPSRINLIRLAFVTRRRLPLLFLWLGFSVGLQSQGQSQPAARPLRVFIDCVNVRCDLDYFRKELSFVDYVRDRREADVHILITSEPTGSGGRDITFRFIGAAQEQTLRRVTAVDATEDQVRQRVLQAIKLGLVPYVADTPAGDELQIQHRASTTAQTTAALDRWNYWVFRPRLNMFVNGESSRRSVSMFASVSVNRVTDASKIMLSVA